MILDVLLLVIPVLAVCVWTNRKIRESQMACAATSADIDAAHALVAWREDHPEECLMHSKEGKLLLLKNIKTYAHFLETHSFIKDNAHLEFLRDLLHKCECEPPPRKSVPQIRKRPQTEAAFVYLIRAMTPLLQPQESNYNKI